MEAGSELAPQSAAELVKPKISREAPSCRQVVFIRKAGRVCIGSAVQHQIARYEAGEQQPVLSVAAHWPTHSTYRSTNSPDAPAPNKSCPAPGGLHGRPTRDGVERIDTHTLDITQRGERLILDAEVHDPSRKGHTLGAEKLRLWDTETLMGWYRSTDSAVRSKGTMYFALHPHGAQAWGRWVGAGSATTGLSSTGLAALARNENEARQTMQSLIDTRGASRGRLS